MENTITVLCWVVGLFFVAAGVNKLAGSRWAIEQYSHDGFSAYTFYGSGIIEFIAGSLLFIPHLRFIGVVSLLAMIAVLELARFAKPNSPPLPLHLRIPALISEIMLLGIAWRTSP